MEPVKIFVKCEEAAASADAADGGAGGAGGAIVAVAGGKRGVGRLVDSTQADDRRMIYLVRERPLLYARSNLPVASYHSQVKKLWREVADIMGWTVADVRRKWSHIRNSYSRHLRNEIHGVRTGRGRMVSKWYLADELEYLREHMATDTRPCPLSMVSSVTSASFAPHFLSQRAPAAAAAGAGAAGAVPHYLSTYELELEVVPEPVEPAVEVQTESLLERKPLLGATPTSAWYSEPAPPSDDASSSCEPDDTASYFQFFRGIYKDYQELSPRRQRRFRRQCLLFLHRLVDGPEREGEEEGEGEGEEEQATAVNLSAHNYSSDSDRDGGGGSALPH